MIDRKPSKALAVVSASVLTAGTVLAVTVLVFEPALGRPDMASVVLGQLSVIVWAILYSAHAGGE